MSFSYSTSLTSDRDKVRLLISDTNSSDIIFQNEELDGILGMEPNVYTAAATALRARTSAFVTKAIRYQIGTTGGRAAIEVDRGNLVKNFLALADHYIQASIAGIDEVYDRAAFDIDPYGRDVSEYQGVITPTGDDYYNPNR